MGMALRMRREKNPCTRDKSFNPHAIRWFMIWPCSHRLLRRFSLRFMFFTSRTILLSLMLRSVAAFFSISFLSVQFLSFDKRTHTFPPVAKWARNYRKWRVVHFMVANGEYVLLSSSVVSTMAAFAAHRIQTISTLFSQYLPFFVKCTIFSLELAATLCSGLAHILFLVMRHTHTRTQPTLMATTSRSRFHLYRIRNALCQSVRDFIWNNIRTTKTTSNWRVANEYCYLCAMLWMGLSWSVGPPGRCVVGF